MSEPIRVLDHGFVRLVDHMGSDLSVSRAARVSYDADWRAGEDQGSDERLIRYLWRNAHTTPFEAVSFIFEVKAPIFVFRQWHRHRTWSFSELSARYRPLPEEFYVPDAALIGSQSKDNKQARDLSGESDQLVPSIIAFVARAVPPGFVGLAVPKLRTVLPTAVAIAIRATRPPTARIDAVLKVDALHHSPSGAGSGR